MSVQCSVLKLGCTITHLMCPNGGAAKLKLAQSNNYQTIDPEE